MALEVWASTLNISLALLLVMLAAVLWTRHDASARDDVVAGVLIVAATLTYEAVIPLALVASVGLPWLIEGRPRWRAILIAVAAAALAAAWILLNWNPNKVSSGLIDPTPAVGSHFGWGIAPTGWASDAILLVAMVGVALVIYSSSRALRSTQATVRSAAAQELGLVLAGLGIIAFSLLPFATYVYEPLGAGDRANVVSSIGGAMVWTGVLTHLWRHWKPVAVVLGCALLVSAVVVRADRVVTWSTAGDDARAILDAIVERVPEPEGPILIGPSPVLKGNIAAFVDKSNIQPALRLVYDDPSIEASIAYSVEEFCASDAPHKIDIHEISRLDGGQSMAWSCADDDAGS